MATKIELNKEQQEIIIKNYELMTRKDLAKLLNISIKIVDRYAKELGLNTGRKSMIPKYPKELIERIKKEYPTLTVCKEKYAEQLGIPVNTLNNYILRYKIKRNVKIFVDNSNKPNMLTIEQKKFLYENYSKFSNKELSKMMKLPIEKIRGYACATGLKKEEGSYNTNNCFDYFLEKRVNNKNYNLSEHINKFQEPKISENCLYKSNYGKYYLNQNYFSVIDNEWKAYWLGFLYADGCNCLSKNMLRFALQRQDEYHIQRFIDSLQGTHKIYQYMNKKNGKLFPQSEVSINNERICKDLDKLGCVENKSLVIKFPNDNLVPKEFKRHFIRGYFDGNGWISISSKNKIVYFGFCTGSYDMTCSLRDYLVQELNITKVAIKSKDYTKATEISWSSMIEVEKIYNYLYNNCNIYLKRKLEKFDKIYCLGQYEV